MKKLSLLILLFAGYTAKSQSTSTGTTNNRSFRIKTNDQPRMVLDSLGNVGIANELPGTLLDIGKPRDTILHGGAAVANVGRLVTRYTSGISSGFVLGAESYVNQPIASTGSVQGLEGFVHTSHNSGTVALAIGTIGNAETTGAGTTTTLRGVQGNVSIRNAGGGTNASAFYASPNGQVGNGSGIFTNGYGLYVGTFGSGFTNKYGVYVSDSSATNFFAGKVYVGGNITCKRGITLGNSFNPGGTDFRALEVNNGSIHFSTIVTATGTTGNQTINKISGTVNIAAGDKTVTVTNDLVTTNSIVMAVIRTNDKTAVLKNVVPGNGSFVINLETAATAETSIGFFVINK